MEEKVRAAIERHRLFTPGERVVVAVSGGADSVALLHLLWRWRTELGLDLHVAHLNHRLRPEAEEEAAFVRRLAQAWGLPLTVGQREVACLARSGESLEDVARRVRRRFLAEVADAVGAAKIALGHHANDQAETVLLHLLRGSGATGLAGMAWQRGKFVRPLLGVTRTEIEAYCRRYGLSYVRDPSNAVPAFLRNRVRHELLPLLLERYNPNLVRTLGQTAAILAEEEAYLESALDRVWPELKVTEQDGRVLLRVAALLAQPLALQRRAVRRAFFTLVGRENPFLTFDHVEEVLTLATTRGGRRLHLPRGVVVGQEAGNLVFAVGKVGAGRPRVCWPVCRRLPVPGEVLFGDWLIKAALQPAEKNLPLPAGHLEAACDFGRLPQPLFLRYWQPGDFFWPLGLGGRKKLQDFFVDAKVPREERAHIPLVVCPEGIVWIVGYRLDERWRVRPDTTAVLRLYARRQGSPSS